MLLIGFIICVAVIAVIITIDVSEERRRKQKIAELEAQVGEKNALINQLTVSKRGE